ncbi:MerR family transcriptional regulator [Enterococcus durans]|uniref:MerR family transcriptional regulator n=1 Tax=Enterococcus durans TaxID=53345 RepID=UPI0039A5041A
MHEKILINEVADLLNIPPSTIRFWEKKQLFHLPRDEENNYRYFDKKSLLEIIDIAFFRRLKIPVKRLKNYLQGDLNEREINLIQTKKILDDQIRDLMIANEQIDKMLKNIQMVNQLKGKKKESIPFQSIDSLDFFYENHANQYLIDPTDFILYFSGEEFKHCEEGIIGSTDHMESEKYLWKNQSKEKSYYSSLLTVDAMDYQRNDLKEIKRRLGLKQKNYEVVCQYLTSGKENDKLVDYYKCWFIEEIDL